MDSQGGTEGETPRNRPASGAAYADSPQELDLNWKGNSAATDFLGIDGDGPSDDAPAAIGSSLDTSGEVGLPSDSWLHGIEGEEVDDERTGPEIEGKLPPLTGEDARLEAIHEKVTARRTSSKLLVIAAGCTLLCMIAAGGWYWKTHMRNAPVDTSTGVVTTLPTPPKPVTPPAGTGETTTTTPQPDTDTTIAHTDPEIDPNADLDPIDPEVATTTDPTEIPPPVAVVPTVILPDVSPTLPVEPEPVRAPGVTRVLPPSDTPIPGAVRRATEADFADLWRAPEIPTAEISGDRKLLTLNVGRVRLMLQSGEYFEGDLYAVGMNRVWLNLDLGRISFEAATVREMKRITAPSAKAAFGKQKPEDLAGLPHVEVRMPGGSITGRMVGRDGNRITLVTDDGMRTVLDSSDVRPVTPRKTRVLGPVEKLGGVPAPKNPPAPAAAPEKR
ncbi:MAG: hypothetical protein JNL28_05355 [Planctomycetes bacterium]|nr:hypothetical protein [Planctomycetota bacterium]